MSICCSLDTSFLLSYAKESEDESESCHYFLDNVKIDVFIPLTVKEEYFEVTNYRMEILFNILKEIRENKPNTFDELRNELRKTFDRYKRNPDIDSSTRAWIKEFEPLFSKKTYEFHDEGVDNIAILFVLKKILADFYKKLYTSFDLAIKKCKGVLKNKPCEDLCKAIGSIIHGQKKDAEHLAVSIEHGIRNNLWVFFVSLDDLHILKYAKQFHRQFFFIIIINSLYALDAIKKFDRNKPIDILKRHGTTSASLRRLDRISQKNFGVKILLN